MRKEYPILFNEEMVNAILNNQKTMTRRIFSSKVLNSIDVGSMLGECYPLGHPKSVNDDYIKSYCPFGQVGDRIWVRETFADGLATKSGYAWRAGFDAEKELEDGWWESIKWKPSIHMPRSACRLILEITDIRYERLQSISEADAIAEGCDHSKSPSAIETGWYEKPVKAFKRLWTRVYGQESLDADPWVWVIGFKIIKRDIFD